MLCKGQTAAATVSASAKIAWNLAKTEFLAIPTECKCLKRQTTCTNINENRTKKAKGSKEMTIASLFALDGANIISIMDASLMIRLVSIHRKLR